MNRSPLAEFAATVRINKRLRETYFDGVDISEALIIRVDPATLSRKDDSKLA